ncbi:nagb/rpia/CoA transferase-like protein [Lindgomyces ingoldianus]|uniref:Nagb/rpia/CoA transferase-like protein n=1 Tax=Lindgomyces ingoldianus TaxID=673940 RepID=A0ACB6QPK5_9PLEO|nr:nagb/rpia/CoA transferase-like protein [Lindgomyces ingoldianus]KAF2468903.1 nagb/rpia/CoA transferase-like protein [Lindgomyces ingoldianus]
MSETPGSGAAQPPPAVLPIEIPSNPPLQPQGSAKTTRPAEAAGVLKLSAAELKKKKQAEKQARRAQTKGSGGPPSQQKGAPPKDGFKQVKELKQAAKDDKLRPMSARRRPSQSEVTVPEKLKKEIRKEPKQQGLFFGHLYNQPRQHSMVGASKDVHPAVLALGLQYSSYVVCGSTARMVSMLLAFKAVIESYSTPVGTSLARHLTSHHLSPQIDYLRSCRPLSISMGNAIRWLKDVIIKIDPSTPEAQAKRDLLSEIDNFILQRITAADELISETAAKKIEEGDVILTYASSSIVEKTFLRAHNAGIKFSVMVVDSGPLFEGERLARDLANHGLQVRYRNIRAASHAVRDASKVFLGAHAMMSNGRLYSRVGTAVVSMLANDHSLPVIVLCESVKFTERVALDSIVGNEVAPAEELLSESERQALLSLKKPEGSDEAKAGPDDVLKWIAGSDTQMLQVLYDVTPAEYINMVITEYGSLPPSSVPVVHRLSTNT